MSTSPPPAPRRPRPFDAVKWFGLAVLLTGVGVGAQAALGQKADVSALEATNVDVRQLQLDRATENERARWHDAMLCGIAKQVGAPVAPNPICP
jgi:hypothetical protein